MREIILVVEDDFDTRYPLAELLRLKGYNVLTASDAERAFVEACQSKPDLIITDIALPGRNGIDFILRLRADQHLRSTPVIVISGCGEQLLREAHLAGANCCLEKPIRLDRLWVVLAGILSKEVESDLSETGAGNSRAAEIELMIEEFRKCSSKEEREALLVRLKESLLETGKTKSA